jgi:hypothetical protein
MHRRTKMAKRRRRRKAKRDLLTRYKKAERERARTRAELDGIARQAKQALAAQNIDLPVFFVIPNSGDAFMMFGTPGDPAPQLWKQVSEIVMGVVSQAVGLPFIRSREVECATTETA